MFSIQFKKEGLLKKKNAPGTVKINPNVAENAGTAISR
jgi:hypothetical protein